MASPLCIRFSGCALATMVMLASASGAYAATGRIAFSGAVMEPTCSTEGIHADAPARSVCGKTPTDPGRSYSRIVLSLDAATIATDRLLGYYAGYATADSAVGQPKLVIRTYD